ncbi:heavy-metal-associated domain-containing protein [Fulvivirga sp. M361]|uniref:heavy-metal-associated domain-containing protein n=1 Tax=Fulvivirga sp. M361 TaxID=2594266 RepID=UPI00117BC9AB|nr:heavy metal-associated domain-containing protein [Fulvivirga sp. M361]TRX49668.1 heavy-metal-associated domain-containing protein [Fulvivirga sp. M361]
MTKEYTVTGMTCNGCLAKVKRTINGIEEIQEATIQLEYPQAKITANESLNLKDINQALKKVGNYTISEEYQETIQAPLPEIKKQESLAEKSITTYKPLILIVGFIAAVTALSQYPFSDFSGMLWMRHFMAGFFIVFAFFKLLNLQGFANSYRMYDIVAAKWKTWGYVYPFLELALGILYLINLEPFYTNIITIIVLGVSSIGVIKSNLDKKKIKCACLGEVFNLPMSTVTIVEDLSMVSMAAVMLVFI